MRISLERAATMLGTSQQMLRRWVEQGAIPCDDTSGECEFDLETLETWAKKRRLPFSREVALHAPKKRIETVDLHHAMQLGGVHFGLEGGYIPALFLAAVQRIELHDNLKKTDLLEQLLAREEMASTGIGNGVAIPHPRHPIDGVPQGGMVVTFFLDQEVDFNAVDGLPVSVLFLMLSPHTKCHLQLLSQLSFCLHDAAFLAHLKTCTSKEELLHYVKRMRKKITGTEQLSGS